MPTGERLSKVITKITKIATSKAEADGFKRGLEKAAVFEETVCLEDGKLVQHTKDEASIEQQLKAEAIRALATPTLTTDCIITFPKKSMPSSRIRMK